MKHDIKIIKDMHLAIAACLGELEAIYTAREADLRQDRHQSDLGLTSIISLQKCLII